MSPQTYLKVPIKELESYAGFLGHVASIARELNPFLKTWRSANARRPFRPPLKVIRGDSASMLEWVEANYPNERVHAQLYVRPCGSMTLHDLRYAEDHMTFGGLLDKDVQMAMCDASATEAGIVTWEGTHPTVKSFPKEDFQNPDGKSVSVYNELWAICRSVEILQPQQGRRYLVMNDNQAAVSQFNKRKPSKPDAYRIMRPVLTLLKRQRAEAVAVWLPGVMVHLADDASRTAALHDTEWRVVSPQGVVSPDPPWLGEHVSTETVVVCERMAEPFSALYPCARRAQGGYTVHVLKKSDLGSIVRDEQLKDGASSWSL
jgi:hypothetical protein